MPTFLVPVEKGQTVALDKAVTLFGRHPDCDVVLTRSRKVSRKHCCVAQVNHRFLVRDLGSMNGVRINGKKVTSQGEIKIGDELAVGDVRYRVTERGGEKKKKNRPDTAAKPDESKPVPDPAQVSRDVPVPIPEEENSFLVEASMVDVNDEDEDQDDQVLSSSNDYIPPLRDQDILPPIEDL